MLLTEKGMIKMTVSWKPAGYEPKLLQPTSGRLCKEIYCKAPEAASDTLIPQH